MKIIIEPTEEISQQEGTSVPARIWTGKTETGVEVYCVIPCIAIDINEPGMEEFKKELLQFKNSNTIPEQNLFKLFV